MMEKDLMLVWKWASAQGVAYCDSAGLGREKQGGLASLELTASGLAAVNNVLIALLVHEGTFPLNLEETADTSVSLKLVSMGLDGSRVNRGGFRGKHGGVIDSRKLSSSLMATELRVEGIGGEELGRLV